MSLILGFAGLAAFALLQRQEAIRQRDLAVQRGQVIRTNVEWMNFKLRDMLQKYAPSGVRVEANRRIDELLRAVERLGGGDGFAGEPTTGKDAADLDLIRARWVADVNRADALLGDADANPAEARAFYENALRLAEELVKLDPDQLYYHRDVSVSYNCLGDLQMRLGNTAKALGYYEKALAVREELAKLDTANTEFRRDVSISYERLGDVQLQLGDTVQALGFYEKGGAVAEELVKLDPANTEFRRDVAVSHAKLGQFREAQGAEGRPAALAHYRKVVEILEGMKAAGVLGPADEESIAEFRAKVAELE